MGVTTSNLLQVFKGWGVDRGRLGQVKQDDVGLGLAVGRTQVSPAFLEGRVCPRFSPPRAALSHLLREALNSGQPQHFLLVFSSSSRGSDSQGVSASRGMSPVCSPPPCSMPSTAAN